MKRRNVAILVSCAATLSVFGSTNFAAFASPSDVIKYLNPIPKKSGYLNQSQDRVIKKKSFKAVEVDGAEPIPNKEIGLFAIVDSKDMNDSAKIEELLSDPRINGLSATFTWNQLEPEETKYNWQTLDNLLDAAGKHNKTVILRVSTNGMDLAPDTSDTPKWVYEAGTKSVSYKGADGAEHSMPVYWDSTYLAKWSNFVHALGERYDKNAAIHSVGITGGGVRGGTAIIPDFGTDKVQYDSIDERLKKDFGMNPHQLVQHWKYVADLFPSSFKTARLNFDIDPPTPNRAGQDMLDEISDYLVYRYGERVYLTRQNVDSSKHGFDQYRVLLKFRPDTLTGYQLSSNFPALEVEKMVKNSLDDGTSFAEVPVSILESKDPAVVAALQQLRARLGYQLVSQKVTLPSDIKSGAPLKAGFTFMNLGASVPMRPNRQLDKDVASSYKVQLELRDNTGKPRVQLLHTPGVPTNQWTAGQPITWEEELKMPKLQPGEYSVFMSLIDQDSKRKLQILNAATAEKSTPETAVAVGKIQVLSE